jgi:hypothetical protein
MVLAENNLEMKRFFRPIDVKRCVIVWLFYKSGQIYIFPKRPVYYHAAG